MPIGTLSTSSTSETMPTIHMAYAFSQCAAFFGRLLEHLAAAQVLHAAVDLENHRDRHEHEAGQQRHQERPHREGQAFAAAAVLDVVLDVRNAPPHDQDHEQERDDRRQDLDHLDGALAARPERLQDAEQQVDVEMRAVALRNAEVQEYRAQDEQRDGILLPFIRHAEHVSPHHFEQREQRAAEQHQRGCTRHEAVLERAPVCIGLLHAPGPVFAPLLDVDLGGVLRAVDLLDPG